VRTHGARRGAARVHQLLSLLEHPEEGRECADIERVRRDGEQVVENACNLRVHDTDVLRAKRDVDAQQLLDSERVTMLLAHHRHVVEAVKVRERLVERLVLDQLLRATVQQPDVRVAPLDRLALQLQHQAQHAVRRRVLRPKVQRKVPDLRADEMLVDLEGCSHIGRRT
jgi:hypothetical protein